MADSLGEIIDIAKRDLADVPDHVWQRFERLVRANFGATRVYIAAHRKRAHLEALAADAADQTAQQLSEKLNLTVRRVRQLVKLNEG